MKRSGPVALIFLGSMCVVAVLADLIGGFKWLGFVAVAGTALGTLGLAFYTYELASATLESERHTQSLVEAGQAQAETAKLALDLSMRPLLADPRPPAPGSDREQLLFGAPGRISVEVQRGKLFYQGQGSGAFHLSVAFENIGAGVAAILEAMTDPVVPGDIYWSRRFVPVGAIVRVNISVLVGPDAERFSDHWWAMDPFAVLIRYTDANGHQVTTTRASFSQAATQAPFIREILVTREQETGSQAAVGRGSY